MWYDLHFNRLSKFYSFYCPDQVAHELLFCFTGPFCEPLPPISNGRRSEHSRPVSLHTVVKYSCMYPFRLIGEKTLACVSQDNKAVWNKAPPVCEYYNKRVICPDPKVPGGYIIQGTKPPYIHGDSVTFTCKGNLTMKGSKSVWCQQNKEWGPTPLPKCESGEYQR